MVRAFLYFGIGTLASFLFEYFLLESHGWALDLDYAVAFGSAWGIAYYLDTPEISLSKKLGFSFIGMGILAGIGIGLIIGGIVGYVSKGSAVREEQKKRELKQLKKEKEDLEKQAAELAKQQTGTTYLTDENKNPQNY